MQLILLPTRGAWRRVSICDARSLALYKRHYSHNNPRRFGVAKGNLTRFAGPGEVMVLLSNNCNALFTWRKERYRLDKQAGVNCAVFRNESELRSSDLIREACALAWQEWPGQRLFTFVDAKKIRSSNPGYCFIAAGWRPCGTTKGGLRILELLPGFETEQKDNN